MIGVIDDVAQARRIAITAPEENIYVIGNEGLGAGWLSNSVYAHIIAENIEASAPPPVDLAAERRHGDTLRALNAKGLISAAHDIGDGGILVALAEMLLAGNMGAQMTLPAHRLTHDWAFGEDQARYLVAAADSSAFEAMLTDSAVPFQKIAMSVAAKELKLGAGDAIALTELRRGHEDWLPNLMKG